MHRRNKTMNKTNNQNLIDKSIAIFNGLNIKELQKAGIEREDIKLSSHSHHIVTYPPIEFLPEISPSEIYSENSPRNPKEVALYLHLPFCTGKCLYCVYITLANQPSDFVDRYLNAVEKEIDLLLKNPNLQDITINSVYIGGGTPTYLSVQQIGRVFQVLRSKFKIGNDIEITVEAEPETIIGKKGEEKLRVLLQNGVNRLSIGFQTFNDDVLKLLRRRHNSKQAIESYNLAKKVGFENINIDLIPGLPDQTLEIWQSDLEKISELEPTSITCYPLSIKKTAALWLMYQKEKERFPSHQDVITMCIMADEYFSNLSYIKRPVWWYTKTSEYVYRQQIHKWGELGEQLALGVSGYSFVDDFQYSNYRITSQYLEAVERGDLPIYKGTKLSEEDLMRRLILFGLKVGLSKKLFQLKFNKNPKDVFKDVWEKLEKLGLIEEDDELIELSDKGSLFADEIAKEFFSKETKDLLTT